MNTIINIIFAGLLLNAVVLLAWVNVNCWEEFCARRAKKQQDAKRQAEGAAK